MAEGKPKPFHRGKGDNHAGGGGSSGGGGKKGRHGDGWEKGDVVRDMAHHRGGGRQPVKPGHRKEEHKRKKAS